MYSSLYIFGSIHISSSWILCKLYISLYCTHNNFLSSLHEWTYLFFITMFNFSTSSESMSFIKKLFGFWHRLCPRSCLQPLLCSFSWPILFLCYSPILFRRMDHNQLELIYDLTSIAHSSSFFESQGDKIQI